MKNAIRAHHKAGKPILAECGGMLYLFESLSDVNGNRANMTGLLPGEAAMQPRLAAIGLQAVDLGAGELRGHSFHYSRAQTELTPLARGRSPKGGATAEAVYRIGRLTASYIHAYFPSNPDATAALFSP
jgi:cobyrinic acid a,c-diamide synthase